MQKKKKKKLRANPEDLTEILFSGKGGLPYSTR